MMTRQDRREARREAQVAARCAFGAQVAQANLLAGLRQMQAQPVVAPAMHH